MTHSAKPSSGLAADPADRRSGDELRRRLRQQAAVAELGREALAGAGVDDLAASAVEMIAVELGVPVGRCWCRRTPTATRYTSAPRWACPAPPRCWTSCRPTIPGS